MAAREPLLRMCNVTKWFGGVAAVEAVSFDVYPGHITAVIGPNGAGKTTLFNLITAILPLTSGRIFLENTEITRMKAPQIARLGITRTFQNLQIFGNMSVVENVMTGAHTQLKTGMIRSAFRPPAVSREERRAHENALKLLENVGLLEYAYEEADKLPYGNQRLLEIARAAASAPKLILLDEPMAGLNPQESKKLVTTIERMRAEGLTFLFVEHDMETVMSMADHIVVLDFGKNIAEGTPEEIYNNPAVIAAYLGDEGIAL
ncbi:ABC transporter ATP-binding protein [Paenibacillus thiaminolyticus]|uniref:ABC transporter ATP-binding protein n=1 Tax=Paenibacillus thiaminolyticus TaxID=49283 RepID=UPI003D2D4912